MACDVGRGGDSLHAGLVGLLLHLRGCMQRHFLVSQLILNTRGEAVGEMRINGGLERGKDAA